MYASDGRRKGTTTPVTLAVFGPDLYFADTMSHVIQKIAK